MLVSAEVKLQFSSISFVVFMYGKENGKSLSCHVKFIYYFNVRNDM